MSDRPQRIRIVDELGRRQSLPAGADQFEIVGDGPQDLLLGLGPNPGELPALLGVKRTRYVESPEMERQLGSPWSDAIPEGYEPIEPADLTDELVQASCVRVYRQSPRLFPSLFGPVLGRCRLVHLGELAPKRAGTVLMPAGEDDLLNLELHTAFQAAGFSPIRRRPLNLPAEIGQIMRDGPPDFFFSVNLKGLDPHGEVFELLEAAGVPVALWLVDNPFHLLTGLRSPFWRRAHIFVTDDWFIPLLRAHGATNVHHLPLATDPSIFSPDRGGDFPELADKTLFVGRPAFPDRDKFFAATRIPQELLVRAAEMVDTGERPDFGWWLEELGSEELWPGNAVRQAGLGAQSASEIWRRVCLGMAAAELPLVLAGDEAWRDVVPSAVEHRGPVDYYGPLASMYADAGAVLGVTSLLMPSGLTQRHFDVFAAGGLLVSDATPGLSIFPDELVREIVYEKPGDIAPLVQRFAEDSDARGQIVAAWRDHVLDHHTYDKRVKKVLEIVEPA